MTRANTARHAGDEFQARWFWLNAANLLNDRSSVSSVAWEKGPRGLDDIRIDYTPAKKTPTGPVSREQVQSKWHVRNGEFGYQDLIEPSFINARNVSWLQRAYAAFKESEGEAVRFRLLTNWRVAAADPLAALIRTEAGGLDIDRLFTGKTKGSAMGKLRECWQTHLSIDDSTLRAFADSLCFSTVGDSLEELRDRLNDRLAVVGLRPAADHHSAYEYDDLIVKLHQQGDVEFDEVGFRSLCDDEELWGTSPPAPSLPTIGIRSFMHRFDALEDRCDQMLDLVPFFDGRYLRSDKQWDTDIEPVLTAFLASAVTQHAAFRLVLDTHVSIAVAVGRLLDVKSGRRVAIEQRTPGKGREDWEPGEASEGAPVLIETDGVGEGDVVLALGVTHDVRSAVSGYCEQHLPAAHRLNVGCGPSASATSIVSGAHAWRVAEQIAAEVRALPGVPGRPLHLFAAAPNGLAFFLGQQLGLGAITVYEWDFEGGHGGGYRPGLTVG